MPFKGSTSDFDPTRPSSAAFQGSPLSRPQNTIAFASDFGVKGRARWPKSPIRAPRAIAILEKRLSIQIEERRGSKMDSFTFAADLKGTRATSLSPESKCLFLLY
jgi:hypothetical protein